MDDLLLDAHMDMTHPEDANTVSPQNHLLAHVLLDLGRHKEALAESEKAVRLNPEHAFAHCSKGYALLILQHYEEALTSFNKAIHLNPQESRTHHSKGAVLDALGRHQEAQEAYAKARQLGYRE